MSHKETRRVDPARMPFENFATLLAKLLPCIRPKCRGDSCGKSYEKFEMIPYMRLEKLAIEDEKFTICHEICEDKTKKKPKTSISEQ